MRSFVSGIAARDDQLLGARPAARRARLRSSRPARAPATTSAPSVDDADLAGDRLGGEAVVAGDDDDPDAGAVAAGDRGGARRGAAGRRGRRGRGRSGRLGRLARPSASPGVDAAARRRRARAARAARSPRRPPAIAPRSVVGERRRSPSRPPHRARSAPAAPAARPWRGASCAVRLAVDRRHPLAAAGRRRTGAGARSALGLQRESMSRPRSAPRDQQGGLARIAARAASGRRRAAIVALVQRHAASQQARSGLAPAAGRAARRPQLVAVGPDARTLIRPSVSVPVLSVQITSVEPSVSTAVSRLTSARRRAMRRTPTASASVIVGSSPSGTLATISPIAKVDASASGRPGDVRADREEQDARRRRRSPAISRAAWLTCRCSGLELGLDALGQRGDPAELRVHAGRVDDRLGLAARCTARRRRRGPRPRAGAVRPAARVAPSGATGTDSPVSGDRSTSRRAGDQPRVGRQPVALRQQQQVAGHQLGGVDLAHLAVAAHAGPRRQELAQRLGRALGLALLGEREQRVEHDHGDDRDRQRRGAGDQRQRRGGPEQQRERVGELRGQLAEPVRALRVARSRSARAAPAAARPRARRARGGDSLPDLRSPGP